jgi:hypothetical protein
MVQEREKMVYDLDDLLGLLGDDDEVLVDFDEEVSVEDDLQEDDNHCIFYFSFVLNF